MNKTLNELIEFLNKNSLKSTFLSRAKLYKEIVEEEKYTGTEKQNKRLLNNLKRLRIFD